MKIVAVAMRDLLTRIATGVGIEGAFLLAGGTFLAVWSYYAVDPYAPWAVVGALCVLAWLALTTRRA